ncbi:MAG: hypothetical protein FJZ01_05895 [Candidatus Sericytochromatia bacterium]|nr:hypothetical protein [Candidatus Tanganyikabacteria bacterium]
MTDASVVMERIREEFRRRRGDLPPATRTPADFAMDGVHLKQIQHLGRLTDVAIPVSHRKRVGRVVMLVRRALWKLMGPIVRQQSDVNAASAALLAGLLADRDALAAENRDLERRLAALEAKAARPDS